MNAKIKNQWFMLRLLLLINAILIVVIILMHAGVQHSKIKEQSSGKAKAFSIDAMNSITIKLM